MLLGGWSFFFRRRLLLRVAHLAAFSRSSLGHSHPEHSAGNDALHKKKTRYVFSSGRPQTFPPVLFSFPFLLMEHVHARVRFVVCRSGGLNFHCASRITITGKSHIWLAVVGSFFPFSSAFLFLFFLSFPSVTSAMVRMVRTGVVQKCRLPAWAGADDDDDADDGAGAGGADGDAGGSHETEANQDGPSV